MGDFFCQFDIQVTHFLLRRVYSLITGESWGKHYLPPARTRLASCHNTDEDACTTWVFAGDTRSCTQTVHAHTRSFVCASLGARIHTKKSIVSTYISLSCRKQHSTTYSVTKVCCYVSHIRMSCFPLRQLHKQFWTVCKLPKIAVSQHLCPSAVQQRVQEIPKWTYLLVLLHFRKIIAV